MTNESFNRRHDLAHDFPKGSRVLFSPEDPRKAEGAGSVGYTGEKQVYVYYDDGPNYAIGTYPENLTHA